MVISVRNSGPTAKKCDRFTLVKLFLSALIPLMIGLFTIITTIQQQKSSFLQRDQDKQDALLLRQHSELQADNLNKEKVFATYLEDVSKLFKQENNRNILVKIRAKTLATLRQLDKERKRHLFLFLYDSELIYRAAEKPISSVLKVEEADFNGVYFQGTNHTSCSLRYLHLHKVYLSNASFINCFIDHSNFSSAIMLGTVFTETRFLRTSFKFALLDGADFTRATFFQMFFTGATLVNCSFTDVSWVQDTVDFTGANLKGAIISPQQLAKSVLYNSMLPNGTWGPILEGNLVVNGDAEQNTTNKTHLPGWNVSTAGVLSYMEYSMQEANASLGKYYFGVIPSYTLKNGISMTQNISFDKFVLLISAGIARYNLSIICQCSGNQYGHLTLTFIDLNGLTHTPIYRRASSATQRITVSNIFNREMRSVILKIAWVIDKNYKSTNTTNEENYCIIDNIEFMIRKIN